MDIERDKITVIQSLLLMSHRYADTEDPSGQWHWIGVAITLSHTVGLHRNPGLGNSTRLEHPYFDHQMFTWRRIWWSCFYLKTWLRLSHGRPMRIHLDDCNMSIPLPEDMWTGTAKLPADIRQKYLSQPQDCEALSQIHLANLKLSMNSCPSHATRSHQRHAFLQLELYTLALRKMIPSTWTARMTIDLLGVVTLLQK